MYRLHCDVLGVYKRSKVCNIEIFHKSTKKSVRTYKSTLTFFECGKLSRKSFRRNSFRSVSHVMLSSVSMAALMGNRTEASGLKNSLDFYWNPMVLF